uniref:RAB34, member RAS oncogene family b n=2 Tax=Cyprinus carpio carpio TaxID=630221 RepID=A0A9J8BLS7_CYPCA
DELSTPVKEYRIICELPLMCNTLRMNIILLQIYISRLNVAKVIVVGDVGSVMLIYLFSLQISLSIIVVFDLSNYNSLDHGREWLEDAMRDNDPSSVLLFLVGTKKDLSHPDQLAQMEQEAVRLAEEIRAEYWAVSALSGEGVRDFFLRVASLTFEATVLSELERNNSRQASDIVKISNNCDEKCKKRQSSCCH